MKLWDIAKTVGTGLLRTFVPGAGAVIDTVNAVLPEGKKLGPDATGDDLASAVQALPPEQRAELMGKEFEVDIVQIKESNSTVRTMLETDAANPQSTRPYIAKHAFHVIAFAVIAVVSLWVYAVGADKSEMVKAIMDGWEFILAVIGPFVTLLWAYFGILKQEHRQRMNAATGRSTETGLTGMISSIVTAIRK